MEYKKLTNAKSDFPFVISIIIFCFALAFGTAVYALLKINKLENDLDELRGKHGKLQENFVKITENGGLFAFDDDSNFEYQLDDVSLQDYEDYENDDYNHNDEFMDEEKSEGSGGSQSLLKGGGAFTKIGLEEKRQKRDIVATTLDGVPVNSESYADAKNKSEGKGSLKIYPRLIRKGVKNSDDSSSLKHYNSLAGKTTEKPILSRRSRVMHAEDKSKAFRRIVKKPIVKSGDASYQEHAASPEVTIIRDLHHRRRHRQRRVESFNEPTYPRLKPTIHLNGEIQQSTYGYPENVMGNGRLHHYDQHFKNWTRETWVQNLGMDQYFEITDGYLTILESGVYLIYAQIFYVNQHDTNGFRVYKNEQMILQCTTTSHTSYRVDKSNTCFTAGVQYITEGDRIRVHDIEANRYSIFEPGKSFFGAVKLGDGRIR